jgi:hypothetical protein
METSSRSSNKETKDDYRGDIVYIYIYIYIYIIRRVKSIGTKKERLQASVQVRKKENTHEKE